MVDSAQESTMDLIVEEISAVGRRLEGMDSAMVSLTAETKSIRLDIAGFQTRVLGLEQRVTRRDNVRFLGFPENIEGGDIHALLRETLPKFTGITFNPPLEFQGAHRLGPRRPDTATHPRSITACLLRHAQARQHIERARTHSPCQMAGQVIRKSADFSKETSERRREFLALRPRIRQMEVKYGLFEPGRMKNCMSKDFYDPEDLCSFLDGLSSMGTATPYPPRGPTVGDQNALPQNLAPGRSGFDCHPTVSHPRGWDLERLMNSHDNRGQEVESLATLASPSLEMADPSLTDPLAG
ncbi:hypothetical protein NDU88_005339 [Pleurodeles waltl]|uniref:Uncharacterized protein n=1 Tax=Pleurodeles waltl TaxID=8319 RepID=A0AAV7NR86_PLEWA|nr:hypothetical protein NDU88_005339 [Pleurodeles waltl]